MGCFLVNGHLKPASLTIFALRALCASHINSSFGECKGLRNFLALVTFAYLSAFHGVGLLRNETMDIVGSDFSRLTEVK